MTCPEIDAARDSLFEYAPPRGSIFSPSGYGKARLHNEPVVQLAADLFTAIEANSESLIGELLLLANRFENATDLQSKVHQACEAAASLFKKKLISRVKGKNAFASFFSGAPDFSVVDNDYTLRYLLTDDDSLRFYYPQLLEAIETSPFELDSAAVADSPGQDSSGPFTVALGELRRLIDDDLRSGTWGCFLLRECRDSQARKKKARKPKELTHICCLAPQLESIKRAADRLLSPDSEKPMPTADGECSTPLASEETRPIKLRPCDNKAYEAHEHAASRVHVDEDKRITLRDVHGWLQEYGYEDYDLPDYDTWERYVRKYRRAHGLQINSPVAGRKGRSVVRQKDK